MSQVILLNGSSSSGKTTLAVKLQQILTEPFQHISLDQFRDGMPIRYRGLNSPAGSPGASGINIVPDLSQGEPVTHIEFGAYGEQLLKGMRRAIRTLSDNGINVIVDDLLFKPAYLQDYVAVLDPHKTWFVGLHCAVEQVNKREQSRLGRFPGTAVAHMQQVHDHGAQYDLELDTGQLDPRSAAESIMACLAQPPQAFLRIRQAIQS